MIDLCFFFLYDFIRPLLMSLIVMCLRFITKFPFGFLLIPPFIHPYIFPPSSSFILLAVPSRSSQPTAPSSSAYIPPASPSSIPSLNFISLHLLPPPPFSSSFPSIFLSSHIPLAAFRQSSFSSVFLPSSCLPIVILILPH